MIVGVEAENGFLLGMRLLWNKNLIKFTVFSATRRSRSDVCDSLTHWVSINIDFTDMTLMSEDTYGDEEDEEDEEGEEGEEDEEDEN